MTTIQSSQSGSAYANALAKLLERMQSANDTQSGSTSSTTSTTTTATPSLASVLAADDDDTSSTSTQTSSTITALMMDIQQLKSAASSSSTASGSSSSDGGPPSAADIFAKSDTDGNGSLSLSEFVSSRPDGMSEDDAKSMFNAIDSSGTGSVTEDQLQSYMDKNKPVGGHHHHGGGEDASKIFSKIDSDSSGSVSLSEFVAGRPKDMSEDDATKIFKSIDTAGTGSITEDQFAANLKAEHEKAGAAHHTKGADGTESQPDMKALAQDLVTQLKEVIQTFNNGYVDGGDGSAPADTVAVG